jgi:O-antigen/teichoic acid export membrane protein
MLETLIGIPLVLLRINEKAFAYAFVVITETILSLGLQIYFIINTQHKLDGIFISKALAPLLAFMILVPYLIKSIKFHIDLNILKEVLLFSYPLMFASLVSTLFNNQNRFILGYLTDSKEVGLFGLGNNIAGILTFILISPFALTFPQIFWKKINDSNASRFFTKSVTYSFFVLVYGALVLSIATPHFIKLFARNPDYWSAAPIVPYIAFSLVLYGMQVIGFMSFYHHKKTSVVLIILVASAIFNIILNLILIPSLKMYGAAISTYLSFLASTILMYILSKKYYFIKWENSKLVISMIVGISFSWIYYLVKIDNVYFSILFGLFFIVLFPFSLYPFKFYEKVELVTISNTLKKILYGKRHSV